jgi:hypothetical protein
MVHLPFFFDFIIPIIIFLKRRFIMKLTIKQCSSFINYFLFITPSSSHSYRILHHSRSVMQINVFTIPRNSLYMAQKSLVGKDLLIIGASRSHSDTPQPVWLPWTSDQPDTGISTWQHTTLTTDTYPCPQRDSKLQSQQASGCRTTP